MCLADQAVTPRSLATFQFFDRTVNANPKHIDSSQQGEPLSLDVSYQHNLVKDQADPAARNRSRAVGVGG